MRRLRSAFRGLRRDSGSVATRREDLKAEPLAKSLCLVFALHAVLANASSPDAVTKFGTLSSSTLTAAHISGPNNSTPPAAIASVARHARSGSRRSDNSWGADTSYCSGLQCSASRSSPHTISAAAWEGAASKKLTFSSAKSVKDLLNRNKLARKPGQFNEGNIDLVAGYRASGFVLALKTVIALLDELRASATIAPKAGWRRRPNPRLAAERSRQVSEKNLCGARGLSVNCACLRRRCEGL